METFKPQNTIIKYFTGSFRLTYIIALLLIFFSCQSKFVYHPDKQIIGTPKDKGLNFESVSLETQDKIRISGWWIPAHKPRGVVLFCHGNAGNISYRLESIKIFNKLGLSVFIFDYRGYGKSKGEPSESGTYLDAVAAWDYLIKKRNICPNDIIIFGRSLGGSIAAWLATGHNSRMLIAESTFTSIEELGKNLFPSFFVSLILSYKYSTIEYIKNVQCPVLIIHSVDDDLIPFEHGMRLFESAKGEKELLKIHGSHNEAFFQSLQIYEAGLNKFISRHLRQ